MSDLYLDVNGVSLKNGDIFDINQTVNGRSLFTVISLTPLKIVYAYDHQREYEYPMQDLIAPCRFTGEPEFEIVGNYLECRSVKNVSQTTKSESQKDGDQNER